MKSMNAYFPLAITVGSTPAPLKICAASKHRESREPPRIQQGGRCTRSDQGPSPQLQQKVSPDFCAERVTNQARQAFHALLGQMITQGRAKIQ